MNAAEKVISTCLTHQRCDGLTPPFFLTSLIQSIHPLPQDCRVWLKLKALKAEMNAELYQ